MKHISQTHGEHTGRQDTEELSDLTKPAVQDLSVCLLTGGSDRPYVHGLTNTLSSMGVTVDLIGSDELDEPDFRSWPGVSFLNLRGDQRPNAGFIAKTYRILAYYLRLIRYAFTAKPRIFHILWNNRFEMFDRTLLMLYYKVLRKSVVFTAHNVNKRKRDSTDSVLNRMTLRIQYWLADHIFVHTSKMKNELIEQFGVPARRITVIPFGINNSVPNTNLSTWEAKERLGIRENRKSILFFGRIKPYKGLEYLITAFRRLAESCDDYQLIIAGRLEEGCERYWESIQREIQEYVESGRIILRIEFIPDGEIEVYFKGADVLVLPYKEIFQSGVIFLGYNFGLPAIVADVGSLKDEIVEGKTGLVFRPEDPNDLSRTIERYFTNELFADLSGRRQQIRDYAMERHSWALVGQMTTGIYRSLLGNDTRELADHGASRVTLSD